MAEPIWGLPPLSKEGKPTIVYPTIHIVRVNGVDTTEGTITLQIRIELRWTDPRLRNWNTPVRQLLPADLWVPQIRIDEARPQDSVMSMEKPRLEDAESGHVQCCIDFAGTINNEMALDKFPVDLDDISITFTFLDGRGDCRSVIKELWDVATCNRLNVPEFDLVGVLVEQVARHSAVDQIKVTLMVRRGTLYYFWKVLVPLGLTLILGQVGFLFPVDELSDKVALSSTLLLSVVAFLYVIAQDIPKTQNLTAIDKVLLTTMILLVLSGVMCGIIYKLALDDYRDEAESINTVCLVGVPTIYVAVCLVQLVPPLRERRIVEAKARAKARSWGCTWTPWKIVDTSDALTQILATDGKHIFEEIARQAASHLRAAMSRKVEQQMLEDAESKGIMRIHVENDSRALTWSEYSELAKKHPRCDGLPTKEELAESGVNAGDGNDLWMPVRRKDGVEDDYAQIGTHPGKPGRRHFSHVDEYGPTQWQKTVYPQTWRPATYFYARIRCTE